MGFVDAIKSGFSNYVGFQGRARRSEYWFFYLFYILVSFVTGFLDGLIFGTTGLFTIVGILALLLPMFALGFRRLHDTGRSAWWLLIGLIPLVGFIVLLVFYVQDSQPGTNKYGPNPKGIDTAVFE
ncbi:DUF805 domain-containing protein [Maricaulis sp. D1M11]|uniref:DUF805 domain-containing protein n=1 Tax=Maricaulis sp. D1M11 TaxID=3076117 RepID=UPI0039B69BA0